MECAGGLTCFVYHTLMTVDKDTNSPLMMTVFTVTSTLHGHVRIINKKKGKQCTAVRRDYETAALQEHKSHQKNSSCTVTGFCPETTHPLTCFIQTWTQSRRTVTEVQEASRVESVPNDSDIYFHT